MAEGNRLGIKSFDALRVIAAYEGVTEQAQAHWTPEQVVKAVGRVHVGGGGA